MKKFNLIILFIISLVLIPNIKALDVYTSFVGSNVVNEGYTTNVYVKVDAKTSFNKIDICYNTSGAVSILDVNAIGGMRLVNKYSARSIIESDAPIPSGTEVLAFTIKGNYAGEGSLKITSIKVYNGDEVIAGVASIYSFNVNPQKTEQQLLDETNQSALNKSIILVEAVEKSLLEDDYNSAKESVDALIPSDQKNDLEDRLNEVRFSINVKKECSKTEAPVTTQTTVNSKSWILISIVLAFIVIIGFNVK
ncbi:MAG: hypothetical protein Q4E75_06730 [bacterium]|nr:hypothetical protein [bacterium]